MIVWSYVSVRRDRHYVFRTGSISDPNRAEHRCRCTNGGLLDYGSRLSIPFRPMTAGKSRRRSHALPRARDEPFVLAIRLANQHGLDQ